MAHEIGHTGGLWHPHEKDLRNPTGKIIPYRYNPSNFMNWPGMMGFWQRRNVTGVTKGQVLRIF